MILLTNINGYTPFFNYLFFSFFSFSFFFKNVKFLNFYKMLEKKNLVIKFFFKKKFNKKLMFIPKTFKFLYKKNKIFFIKNTFKNLFLKFPALTNKNFFLKKNKLQSSFFFNNFFAFFKILKNFKKNICYLTGTNFNRFFSMYFTPKKFFNFTKKNKIEIFNISNWKKKKLTKFIFFLLRYSFLTNKFFNRKNLINYFFNFFDLKKNKKNNNFNKLYNFKLFTYLNSKNNTFFTDSKNILYNLFSKKKFRLHYFKIKLKRKKYVSSLFFKPVFLTKNKSFTFSLKRNFLFKNSRLTTFFNYFSFIFIDLFLKKKKISLFLRKKKIKKIKKLSIFNKTKKLFNFKIFRFFKKNYLHKKTPIFFVLRKRMINYFLFFNFNNFIFKNKRKIFINYKIRLRRYQLNRFKKNFILPLITEQQKKKIYSKKKNLIKKKKSNQKFFKYKFFINTVGKKNKKNYFFYFSINLFSILLKTNKKFNFFLNHTFKKFKFNSRVNFSFVHKTDGFTFLDKKLFFNIFKKNLSWYFKKINYTFASKNELHNYIIKKYSRSFYNPIGNLSNSMTRTFYDFEDNFFFSDSSFGWKKFSMFTLLFKQQNFNSFRYFNFFFNKNHFSTSLFSRKPNHFYWQNFKIDPYAFDPVNNFDYNFSIKKIKFKPGYSSMWREHRTVFKTSLNLAFRYQKRLTKYILKYKKIVNHQLYILFETQLDNLLTNSKLLPDRTWSLFFLTNGFVFVNGINTTSSFTQLFKNDFIQLILNLKYYILYRWLVVWHSIKKIHFRNKIAKKFTKKQTTEEKQKSKHLPDWILNNKNLIEDSHKFLEIDLFTLSFFIVYEPFLISEIDPFSYLSVRFSVINLLNWKYIN